MKNNIEKDEEKEIFIGQELSDAYFQYNDIKNEAINNLKEISLLKEELETLKSKINDLTNENIPNELKILKNKLLIISCFFLVNLILTKIELILKSKNLSFTRQDLIHLSEIIIYTIPFACLYDTYKNDKEILEKYKIYNKKLKFLNRKLRTNKLKIKNATEYQNLLNELLKGYKKRIDFLNSNISLDEKIKILKK